MRKLSLIALGLLLIGSTALSAVSRTEYESVRSLGMGNATVALADDENALWNNPAGLAFNRKFAFHLIDMQLGVDSADTFNRFVEAIFGGNYDNAVRTDIQYAQIGMSPTFVFPYSAFSLYARQKTYLKIEDLMGDEVDIFVKGDLGAIAGFGLPVGDHIAFGASIRYFLRTSTDLTSTPAQLLLDLGIADPNDFLSAVFTRLQDETTTGLGLGLNLGALVKIPLKSREMKWQFGMTVENFGNTSFSTVGSGAAPDSLPMKINFGTAFNYRLGRKSRLQIAVDWLDFFGTEPAYKDIHAGVELDLGGLALRGGYYQGGASYGLSFSLLPHTRLHFASYQWSDGTDITAPGRRWYTTQLVIGFNPI